MFARLPAVHDRANPRWPVEPLPRDAGRPARWAAAFVLAVGVLVLVGWTAGIGWTIRLDAEYAAMRPNTALCLILLASCWFLAARLAVLASGIVAVVTGLTLAEWAFGHPLGVDGMLGLPVDGPYPGRIAIGPSLCLLVLATAHLCLLTGRGRRLPERVVPQAAGVVVTVVVVVVLLGYLFDVRSLFRGSASTSIALHTAVCLGLLAGVLLRAVPGGYLRWIAAESDPGAIMLHRVLPVTCVVIPGATYLHLIFERAGWFSVGAELLVRSVVSLAVVIGAFVVVAQQLARADKRRVAAMAELQVLNEELDDRVRMRATEVQQARRAADLSHDRERIAADIHDLAIQRLYAVALTLDTASRTGDRTVIGGAIDTIDDVVAELRGTIHNLRKPLGSATLSTTLGEIADIGLERGFSTDVRVAGDVDGLPVAVGVHLGAVLREAVSNALRHSGGDAVSIALTVTNDDISLVVADNGCGLPGDVDRRSVGLQNIRHRAEELGGRATWAPNLPTGTLLAWHVPLHQRSGRVTSSSDRPPLARTVAELVRQVGTSRAPLPDRLVTAGRTMARQLDADIVAVIDDAGGPELSIRATFGYPEDHAGKSIAREASLATEVLDSGRCLKLDHLSGASAAAARTVARAPSGPALLVPVVTPELRCVVSLVRHVARPPFEDRDVEHAEILASTLAAALTQAATQEQPAAPSPAREPVGPVARSPMPPVTHRAAQAASSSLADVPAGQPAHDPAVPVG